MSQIKGFPIQTPYLRQQQILDIQENEYRINIITPP